MSWMTLHHLQPRNRNFLKQNRKLQPRRNTKRMKMRKRTPLRLWRHPRPDLLLEIESNVLNVKSSSQSYVPLAFSFPARLDAKRVILLDSVYSSGGSRSWIPVPQMRESSRCRSFQEARRAEEEGTPGGQTTARETTRASVPNACFSVCRHRLAEHWGH